VVHGRDEEGYEGKPQSKLTFLDDNGAVLVKLSPNKLSDQAEMLSKKVATEF